MKVHEIPHHPEAWLQDNLGAVTRVTRLVAEHRGLAAASVEALESAVFARLAEDDFSVLRRYRAEACLDTYLLVVVSRVLIGLRPWA